MKILQIIYNLSSGGAERFVVDLTNELSRQGHDVTLCILRDDSIGNQGFYKNEIADSVNYINLSIPEGFRVSNSCLLYKVITQTKPDVVHCHLNLINYVFPLTLFFSKIKFFHTIHNHASKEVKSKLEYFIRRYFYKRNIVQSITISQETSVSFKDYYKLDNFNEICNGREKPIPSDKINTVKEEVGKYRKNKNTVFLHIARCNPQKNQEMLIRVFNRLINEGRECVLLVIGSGFDSQLGIDIKQMACDNVYFLGEKKNVADYYYCSDAFCLSSNHEGMPITLIEAMACACIPICTPVGGIVNTIEDKVTGFLSKSVSDKDYYESMVSYLDNKDEINKLDIENYYSSNLTIEACSINHVKLYES